MEMWVKSEKSKYGFLLTGLFLVMFVGFADFFTGYQFSFSLFYLAPIAFITWTLGRRAGFWISIISAVAWFFADYLAKGSHSNLIVIYWNSAVRLAFFLVVVHLLSKNKNALRLEKVLARTDPLTGIRNRRAFFELADIEIDRCRRYDHPLTVTYVDCDDFKRINDEFGHETGDALLCHIAETIQRHTRSMDIPARIGGDEFAILLPETSGPSVREVTNRLHQELLDAMQENNWSITFSLGVVTFLNPPESANAMMMSVDELMYSAKREGKNRVKHKIFDKRDCEELRTDYDNVETREDVY